MLSRFFVLCIIGLAISNPLPIDNTQDPSPLEGDLFEGDIAGVDVNNLKGLAQLDTAGSKKWPSGVVPYTIQNSVYTQAQLNTIYTAMRLIENSTRVGTKDCIKFVPRTTQSAYIYIQSLQGCYSYIGKLASQPQTVSLQAPNCVQTTNPGTAAHEFIHALGFWHEQSRPDRDNYVTIYWNNIQNGQSNNFDKYTTGIDLLGFAYDYNSIMHYQSTAFSVNGQATILPKVSGVSIGNKNVLSSIDIGEIRKYYNCQ